MFDLRLSPEQRSTQSMVRDFANREIKPIALKLDAMAEFPERFPWDVVNKASRMGLRTSSLSVENGGGGADTLTSCLICEELAVGDLGIAVTLGHTSALAHEYFDVLMNAEQRQRFLPDFLADDSYHLAMAIHEPDTDQGYDYFVEEIPNTGDKTRAVPANGGGWALDGEKCFQTNGTIAKLLVVRARAPWGIAAFFVPGDAPGMTRQQLDCSGRRLAGWAQLYFENCVVPPENVVGQVGVPPRLGLGSSSFARVAATTLGVGRAAYEAALEYAKMRVSGGKPIVQHQMVGAALAEMAINLEAARTLCWHAAWAADHPKDLDEAGLPGKPLGRMAILFSNETAYKVACRASTLFGGAGVLRDLPMQKYIRDAAIYRHGVPTDVGLLGLAEILAGYQRKTLTLSSNVVAMRDSM